MPYHYKQYKKGTPKRKKAEKEHNVAMARKRARKRG
jgi:hypothetical protein